MGRGKALLFSYGTLQESAVQVATFGRELTGRADALPGYRLGKVSSSDGETRYWNAVASADPADEVAGMVFELAEEELAAADRYEEDAGYGRVRVRLRSGEQAWVYAV